MNCAINMSLDEYSLQQQALHELATSVYSRSLDNLRQLIRL